MTDFKIIDFEPKYAESTAEMWNVSRDCWGGDAFTKTAESILRDEESSDYINSYVAVENDKVIGYVNFAKSRLDGAAVHLPLLNVRPEYHNKKIGKALVKKIVERAIEYNAVRLDLYTWPGNTKAVPLYKKCGFFWEERGDMTRLMNFIPYLLNNPFFKEYFKFFHWYDDNKRTIEIKPDGIKENDFTYYEYLWEKDDKFLKIQFEKNGKGIRLIETNEFLIKTDVHNPQLVFGQQYEMRYTIVNKTETELKIKIHGKDDDNIKNNFGSVLNVKNQTEIQGKFFVDEFTQEPNEYKAIPSVVSEIEINSTPVLFKTGIISKHPVKITMENPEKEFILNEENIVCINLRNNYCSEASFQFNLKDTDDIEFLQKSHTVKIPKKSDASIAVPAIVKNFHFYKEHTLIKIKFHKGEITRYYTNFSLPVNGITGMFGGETETTAYAFNGLQSIEFDKTKMRFTLKSKASEEFSVSIMAPQLGKPFSAEFTSDPPEKIRFQYDRNAVIMKLFLKSKDFMNILVTANFKLFSNGVYEINYETENIGEEVSEVPIFFREKYVMSMTNGVLPVNGKYIKMNDDFGEDIECWDPDDFTENWIYQRIKDSRIGYTWHKDLNVKFGHWYIYFDYDFGKIYPGQTRKTKPFYAAFNTYEDWRDFRNFAVGNKDKKRRLLTSDALEIDLNSGNPFVSDDLTLSLKEHRQFNFEGEISVESECENFSSIDEKYEDSEEIRDAEFHLVSDGEFTEDIVKVKADFAFLKLSKDYLVLKKSKDAVKFSETEESGKKIFEVDNGKIKFRAALDFSPVVYSLKKNGKEWLNHTFPNLEPKSWWNPFSCGSGVFFPDYTEPMIQNEKYSIEFTELEDNFGNLWKGLKISAEIKSEGKYKGFILNSYHLTLPGVSVMCTVPELINGTGKYMTGKFETTVFPLPSEGYKDSFMEFTDLECGLKKYALSKSQQGFLTNSPVKYSSLERSDRMYYITDLENVSFPEIYTNAELAAIFAEVRMSMLNEESRRFVPQLFYITDKDFDFEVLRNFINIEF